MKTHPVVSNLLALLGGRATLPPVMRPGYKWPIALDVAATRLGVTKGHLHQVLTEKNGRMSPKLKARYEKLASEFARGAAA